MKVIGDRNQIEIVKLYKSLHYLFPPFQTGIVTIYFNIGNNETHFKKSVNYSDGSKSRQKDLQNNLNDRFTEFTYRYTSYYLNSFTQKFLPIEFDYYMNYDTILKTYSKGIKEGQEYEEKLSLYGK